MYQYDQKYMSHYPTSSNNRVIALCLFSLLKCLLQTAHGQVLISRSLECSNNNHAFPHYKVIVLCLLFQSFVRRISAKSFVKLTSVQRLIRCAESQSHNPTFLNRSIGRVIRQALLPAFINSDVAILDKYLLRSTGSTMYYIVH